MNLKQKWNKQVNIPNDWMNENRLKLKIEKFFGKGKKF